MFTTNDATTIWVYAEFILPVSFFILFIVSLKFKTYKNKWKIKKINKQHHVEERFDSSFWSDYYCTKCNQLLYKQPTDIHPSFSKNEYIFYPIHKCIKD